MESDGRGPRPEERSFATTPPYTAFVTFDAFLRRAAGEPIPSAVDKALLISWGIAAGNESGLVTSLKTLGIVDEASRPTDLYHQLRLSPPRRAAALQRSLEVAYPGLNTDKDATIDQNQLHDYFVESRGLTGQMVEKASRFYRQLVAAAESGGLTEPSPASRPAVARSRVSRSGEAQLRLETIEPPPLPVTVRRARSRPNPGRRGTPPLGITVQVQVSARVGEAELVDLFARIQAAWIKSLRRSPIG